MAPPTHRRHLVERTSERHRSSSSRPTPRVDREYYRLLQPHVARAYHLRYDEAERFTVGEPGYFWDGRGAAEGA
jgi:hypothetical protein